VWILALVKVRKPTQQPRLDPLVKERLVRYGAARRKKV